MSAGFEIPLRAAPIGQRVAAAGIDAVLVMTAIAAFAYVFFRITARGAVIRQGGRDHFFLAGAY